MMQANGRPQWRVVKGGSREYVRALRLGWRVKERTSSPVRRVRRHAGHVDIETAVGNERFDQVVMACHGDQALALLADPSPAERDVLEKKTLEEGKPEAAVAKIVEGRLGGFFKEIVLLEQESVTESKKTVKQVLDEAGTTVKRFARFEVGA